MSEASREHKMKFIESFGRRSLSIGVSEALAAFGHDWLTDEQVTDIVRDKIYGGRCAIHQNIRNRAIQKARIA